MTRNLNNITGLGHFLVLLANRDRCARAVDSLRRLRPAFAGAKIPPAVSSIGAHAVVATWGGVTVDAGSRSTVVGVFQRTCHDRECVSPAMLHRLIAAPGCADERAHLLAGNFAAVAVDHRAPQAVAWTAPFRQLPLYRTTLEDVLAFATDARLIVELGLVPRELDCEAIYHYLNFSCIPAPHSAFRRIRKVPAGTRVRARPGSAIEEVYWRPELRGDRDGRADELAAQLREHIFHTVRAYRPRDGIRWGAFLSGGTDSSSITGILAADNGTEPVETYSIGFGEDGYDELEYARIAARCFGAQGHYRTVDEADTLAAIPRLLEAYDEPYGNASAVPTYYCAASAAADGVQLMIAGDGGDESFGGNERYARDAVYRLYATLPARLRRGVAARVGGPAPGGGLLANRIRNFIRRGALPNPERFYREESFASDYFDELLSPSFRSAVASDASLQLVQRHYADAGDVHELHRLMYVDQMTAIADNDLTKVQRAAHAAGVCVSYPYLDPELVTFAGRLHARFKVRGLQKRYLFKRALRELLPAEIISKKKQGFGLPIAVWARRTGPFRELLHDTLRSRRTAERGLFEQDFIERLLDTHDSGSWDMSPELWRLLMLELWQREYIDGQ